MKLVLRITLIAMLLLSAQKSWAQACCSGGVPLSNGITLNYTEPKMAQLQLSWDYNYLNTLMEKSEQIDEETRRRIVNAAMVEGGYQFTDRLSAALMLSAVWQYREIRQNGSVQNNTLASGIGDGILMGRYLVVSQRDWGIGLEAGVKAPLGADDRSTGTGFSLPADMQPGTGSWDGIFRMQLFAQNVITPGLGLQLASSYHLTGTNANFRGSQAYEFGDNWIASLSLGKEFLVGTALLDFTVGTNARYMTHDQLNNSPIPNTGGWWFNGLGTLSYYFNPQIRLSSGAAIPFYRYLEGTQLTTSHKFFVRLYWKFNVKGEQL